MIEYQIAVDRLAWKLANIEFKIDWLQYRADGGEWDCLEEIQHLHSVNVGLMEAWHVLFDIEFAGA